MSSAPRRRQLSTRSRVVPRRRAASKASRQRSITNRTEAYSGYFITINTNRKARDEDHETHVSQRLDRTLQVFFSDADYIAAASNFNWSQDKHRLSEYLDFDNTKTEWQVEVGTNKYGSRVHAHVIAQFHHQSNFWLDTHKLNATLTEIYNQLPRYDDVEAKLTGFYIFIKPYVAREAFLQYAFKGEWTGNNGDDTQTINLANNAAPPFTAPAADVGGAAE
jgi:hypothetical protein